MICQLHLNAFTRKFPSALEKKQLISPLNRCQATIPFIFAWSFLSRNAVSSRHKSAVSDVRSNRYYFIFVYLLK